MAYTKTNWKDRIVENPRTYDLTNNVDGSIILTPKPGEVIEEGTPISASSMNKIEEKLYDVDKGLEPQVTTGTAEAYIADIPESTAIITIIPHIDNVGNTTLNGKHIYDSEGLLINSSDFKKDIPVQLIVRPDRFFVASSGSSKGPELLETDPSLFDYLPDCPTNAYGAAVTYLDGYIYVFGGGLSESTKGARRYKVSTAQWETLPNMPYYCHQTNCVVYNNKIYLVGSSAGGSEALGKGVIIYDPVDGTYSTGAQSPSTTWMSWPSLVVYNNCIYVFKATYLYKYNILENTWTNLAGCAYNIQNTPTMQYCNKAIFVGFDGNGTKGGYYDMNTNTYTYYTTAFPAMWQGRAISLGTVGYIIGNSGGSLEVYMFDFLREELTQVGEVAYYCQNTPLTTDGTWIYTVGSGIPSYEKLMGRLRPKMDRWYLPGGVNITPGNTWCIPIEGRWTMGSDGKRIIITNPGQFYIPVGAILTIKKGSYVLRAQTWKQTVRLTRLVDTVGVTYRGASVLIGDDWYQFALSTYLSAERQYVQTVKYNLKTQTTTVLADSPNSLQRSCAIYDGTGKIHLFGGTGSSAIAIQHLIYDIATDTYTAGTTMPYDNSSICGASKPPILHLYSGTNRALYHLYNIETDTYTRSVNCPASSNSYTGNRTDVYGDTMYLIGFTENFSLGKVSLTTGFYQYNNFIGPGGQLDACGCICEGRAYYIGGTSSLRSVYSRELLFANSITQWQLFNTDITSGQAVTKGSRIYVMGGVPANMIFEIIPNPEQLYVSGKTCYAGVMLEGEGLQDVDQYRCKL